MQNQLSNRRGFTIVELLIALTIASVLTAIALPTLKESLRQNSLARSASLVKGAFINARAQAIRTGRPFGLLIERRRNDIGVDQPAGTPPSLSPQNLDYLTGNYSSRMYYMQSQLEYRGDTDTAAVYPIPQTAGLPSVANAAPLFYFPRSSVGLLFAWANNGNASPASRLINQGTRFSVRDTGYVFEVDTVNTFNVTANSALNLQGIPVGSGTLVSFNFRTFSPTFNVPAGGGISFPAGLKTYQPAPFKFRVNPVRAPLAPVSLTGRTVIDLSISGPSSNPLAFNCQTIVDPAPGTPAIPDVAENTLLSDILVMFAPDGRVEGVYYDQRFVTNGVITDFVPLRLNPSTTVSFNVGFVDGILANIEDGARFPENLPNTVYNPAPNAPPLDTPQVPLNLEPDKVPNYANTDCAWVSIQPLSGAIQLDTVASQPPPAVLSNYYGFGNNPIARNVISARVHQSRRLATGGAVQ